MFDSAIISVGSVQMFDSASSFWYRHRLKRTTLSAASNASIRLDRVNVRGQVLVANSQTASRSDEILRFLFA